MLRIFKYLLKMTDEQMVEITFPGRLLSVIEQNGSIVLYAIVNDEAVTPCDKISVLIRGTGHPTMGAEDAHFIGTVVVKGLVWHVFYSR